MRVNTQHRLPCTVVKPAKKPKIQLHEDDQLICAEGENFRYDFSKHYGVFTSLIVDGVEQLADISTLSACRAPTDNDRNIQFRWLQLDEWQGENLDKSWVKIYDCWTEDNTILVSGSHEYNKSLCF